MVDMFRQLTSEPRYFNTLTPHPTPQSIQRVHPLRVLITLMAARCPHQSHSICDHVTEVEDPRWQR